MISVHVKSTDANSDSAQMSMHYEVTFDGKVGLEVNALEDGGAANPIPMGTKVPLRAVGTTDDTYSTLVYRFLVGELYKPFTIDTGYTPSDKLEWDAHKPGVYRVLAYIKDEFSWDGDDRVEKYYRVVNPDMGPVTIDSVTVSKDNSASYPVNTRIDLRANATGTNNILYSFWVHDAKGWNEISDYTKNNEFSWTPGKSGKYNLLIRAKDAYSGSYEDQWSKEYTITDNQINVTLSDVTAVSDGVTNTRPTITITADAQGGQELLYQFWVVDNIYGWRLLQAYSQDNTCDWTPRKPGNYTILVRVRDVNSGSHEQQYTTTYNVDFGR